MRLWEILPELVPQAWQRWAELARSVPPHDPLRLLKYPSHIEHAAKAGNEATVAMLDLLDDMLRALIAAGIDGRITVEGLNGAEILQLRPSHWLLVDGIAARELRHAIDLGHDRIRLPGESTWDGIWDHGETRWDVGIPETDIAVIEGVVVSYAAPSTATPTPQPAPAASGPAPPHWHAVVIAKLRQHGSPGQKPGGWPKFHADLGDEIPSGVTTQTLAQFGRRWLKTIKDGQDAQ